MRRSAINSAIRQAEAMLSDHGWVLPDFANWTPQDHIANRARSAWLSERQIGWDVTDFGLGRFETCGLVLFCVRNGLYGVAGERPYAEKLLFVGVDQETPFHAHRMKLEDIIVRGGGTLCVEFTHEGMVEPITGEPVADELRIDGEVFPAFGQVHRIRAGQGITIPRGLQHRFWGEDAPVFVAEVSQCNDDRGDNFFLEPIGRFSEIEEDEPTHRLLWNEGGNA
ncbi:D-lyxose/D-mannose family sugar isomerase [Roseinatronobacter alkalisoli]|uniref:D-lyxose ketol-isomerase n=1 Tax=Roseinatronobacter alkalisoli TaxID=3028235 RepID=A0ABT5TA78_9RHOB|nr:D-lyxose/D-mannose family sugar isomerase [Roseinatronobacter sp. HJB301]MDD7972028.1 D-lyxose/D-mannose family sugar isomerase [Roseinatronobacter sp. HJB301]